MAVKSFLEIVSKLAMNVQARNKKPESERAFTEAARARLKQATTCEDAREGVREIVANLIGSEQMAVFEIDYSKAIMWQRWSCGIDPAGSRPIDLLAFPELCPALQGEILAFGEPMSIGCFPEPVSAIVPIPPTGEPAGLLVLFGILPQKEGLTSADRELLAVISAAAVRAVSEERRAGDAWA